MDCLKGEQGRWSESVHGMVLVVGLSFLASM